MHFADSIVCYSHLGLKAKRPGLRKPFYELQQGEQLSRATGRLMTKRRMIDRVNDQYEEVVVDAETGELIHECREPLSEHFGHGSARTPSSQEQ